jgi:hypothetical protein
MGRRRDARSHSRSTVERKFAEVEPVACIPRARPGDAFARPARASVGRGVVVLPEVDVGRGG